MRTFDDHDCPQFQGLLKAVIAIGMGVTRGEKTPAQSANATILLGDHASTCKKCLANPLVGSLARLIMGPHLPPP